MLFRLRGHVCVEGWNALISCVLAQMLMFPFQFEFCWSLRGDSEPPTDGANLSLALSLRLCLPHHQELGDNSTVMSWGVPAPQEAELWCSLLLQTCPLYVSHSVSHSTRWQPNDFTRASQRVRLKSSSGGCHIAGSLCLCVGWHKLTFEMHLDRWEGRARAHGQKSLLKERVFSLQECTPFWQITLRCN